MAARLFLSESMVPVLPLLLLLAIVPNPQEASRLLKEGLLALQANRLTEARDVLESAQKLSPSDPYVELSLAQTYWRLQNKTRALENAAQAGQHSADNPAIAQGLALFYLKVGDSLKAVVLARQAVNLHKTSARENLLGRAEVAAGNPAEGVTSLGAAYQEDPASAAFAFDYAQALLQQSDFTRAADVLSAALAMHGKEAQLQLALGVARYGQRRFEDAIDSFLRTIKLDSTVPQPYVFLGRLLDQAGSRLPEILSDYQSWYSLFPERFEPPLLLAKAELASNVDAEKIAQHLHESIERKADFWESHFVLGQLLAQGRKYQEAAAELERSCVLNPDSPMPHYHLARVYDRLGQAEKANEERAIHQRLTTQQKADVSVGEMSGQTEH